MTPGLRVIMYAPGESWAEEKRRRIIAWVTRIEENWLQHNNPTLFGSCSRSRTQRSEELGFPLRVDGCTNDVDGVRGEEAKPCYALAGDAWAIGAPHNSQIMQESKRNSKSKCEFEYECGYKSNNTDTNTENY